MVWALTSVAALVAGLLVGWWAARGRTQALVQAASTSVEAQARSELATLQEKVRSLTEQLAAAQQQVETNQKTVEVFRAKAQEAAQDAAALQEKTLQLTNQLDQAVAVRAQVQAKLDAAATSLAQANEARAALEQQVSRVPELDTLLRSSQQQLGASKDELARVREESATEVSRLTTQAQADRDALRQARDELQAVRQAKEAADTEVTSLTRDLTELRTRARAEEQSMARQLQTLQEARAELTLQFRSLAQDTLNETSKKFAEQNQSSLGQLLEPLRGQLSEFKGKVEQVYDQEGKERSALVEQVRQLMALNQAMSEEAKNLTQALKGQAKTQGNWGELILERVLEASGLRKNFEYLVQDSQTREDGSRAQPDVVVLLPEERNLVVDSKVSLVAYDRYSSAQTDEEREQAAQQHVTSVRTHIRGLSEKEYHKLYGLKSLDFVLVFIPIEPAFMLAVGTDSELFMDAWNRNVLLVSPSTLLFVVRTVAHLWRQEAQSRNAQEIAARGAELYDKLVGFVADLQKVGDRLEQAKASFDDAQSKLVSGRGNVLRRAEGLRKLGVKPAKALPPDLLRRASGDAEAEEDTLPLSTPLLEGQDLTSSAGHPAPSVDTA